MTPSAALCIPDQGQDPRIVAIPHYQDTRLGIKYQLMRSVARYEAGGHQVQRYEARGAVKYQDKRLGEQLSRSPPASNRYYAPSSRSPQPHILTTLDSWHWGVSRFRGGGSVRTVPLTMNSTHIVKSSTEEASRCTCHGAWHAGLQIDLPTSRRAL